MYRGVPLGATVGAENGVLGYTPDKSAGVR